MLEAGLVAHLRTCSAVTALIGAADKARMYPVRLPQAPALPAISYQRISGVRDRHLLGPSGVTDVRIQIDCWAETYGDARKLAEAVRRALDGFRGSLGGVRLQNIECENDRDDAEPSVKLYRSGADYYVTFEEDLDTA